MKNWKFADWSVVTVIVLWFVLVSAVIYYNF